MITELLVAGLCLGGFECNQAPIAYYNYNKDLQMAVKGIEQKTKDLLGPVIVDYILPYGYSIGLIGSGQTASIPINSIVSIQGNVKENAFRLIFTFDF